MGEGKATPATVSSIAPSSDLDALIARIRRNDAAHQDTRKAWLVFEALLRDLPATDDMLLTEHSQSALRTLRDHAPDLYLVGRQVVRHKCGRHLTDLLDYYVGPPPVAGPPPRWEIATVDELLAQEPATYAVEGFLPQRGVVVVYGESGAAKTSWVLDISCAIAHGCDRWFGRHVNVSGIVLVLAAEGRMRDRVAAYLSAHELPASGLQRLLVIERALNLSGTTPDLERLVECLGQIRETHGGVRMLVIDTVARVLHGADENSSSGMGGLLASVSRIQDCGVDLVVLIHHAGKNAALGARGHSSLRAAADAEIEVVRNGDGTRSARVTKQRDGPDGQCMHFALQSVPLPDGRSSCVLVGANAPAAPSAAANKMTADERIAIDALREEIQKSGEQMPSTSELPGGKKGVRLIAWRDRFYARLGDERAVDAAAKRQAWHRGRKGLLARKIAGVWSEWCWLW